MTQAIEIKKEASEVELFVAKIKAERIDTQAKLTEINSTLVECKNRAKQIEVLEKTVTGPINESLRAAKAVFAPARTAYATLEQALKSKVAEGHAELERQQREQLSVVVEMAKSGQTEQATAVLAVIPDGPEHKGSSVRKVWKFEIVDETVVPVEYLTVDERKIRAAVTLGAREIPGVRIYEDVSVAVRTTR